MNDILHISTYFMKIALKPIPPLNKHKKIPRLIKVFTNAQFAFHTFHGAQ